MYRSTNHLRPGLADFGQACGMAVLRTNLDAAPGLDVGLELLSRPGPNLRWNGVVEIQASLISAIRSGDLSSGGGLVPRRIRFSLASSRRNARSFIGSLRLRAMGDLALPDHSRAAPLARPAADSCLLTCGSYLNRRTALMVMAQKRKSVRAGLCARVN